MPRHIFISNIKNTYIWRKNTIIKNILVHQKLIHSRFDSCHGTEFHNRPGLDIQVQIELSLGMNTQYGWPPTDDLIVHPPPAYSGHSPKLPDNWPGRGHFFFMFSIQSLLNVTPIKSKDLNSEVSLFKSET